jgi:hypothetical protein
MESEPQLYLVMGKFLCEKPVFGIFVELLGDSDRRNYVNECDYWQPRILLVKVRIFEAEVSLTILQNA